MANPLIDKLKKNSTIKETSILEESTFFKKKELTTTAIPALNLAQSGELDGGFGPGLTVWAGPSKHFKTNFLLLCIAAYLKKFKDAVCLFYDSEFGTPQSYFVNMGIPLDRVIHVPITNIEQLKFDLMKQLDGLSRGDKVFVAVDSVGNLASKKEVEDALNEKAVTDMTRAKQLKSLFRMVTPHFTIKDIPCHVVNHTYQTQEMYSKTIVSGGTGIYYSADNIYVLGRQQDKDGDELEGWHFIINVEKSRYVREKSKIPVTVSFDRGISPWSGLLDLAIETGHVIKPKVGWYTRPGIEGDKSWRAKETNSPEFWLPILKNTDFPEKIREMFQLAAGDMMAQTNYVDATEVIEDDGE
jgi:hypothetical protein